MTSYFPAYADEVAAAARSVDAVALDRVAEILRSAYVADRTVFSCGNGGSAAIANHTQCDHVKGVRAKTGLLPRVVSLSNNVESHDRDRQRPRVRGSLLVSARMSRPRGRRAGRDLVVGSLAEHHPSARVRRGHDLRTIALTGFDGGAAREMAEASIHVDCANYGVIEDVHQSVMHALASVHAAVVHVD